MATVQFHPPVYGAECVSDYIVKAAREEEVVVCSPAHTDKMTYTYTYACPVSGNNGTGCKFTAEAITPGPAGTQYHVNTSIHCCK